MTRKLIVGNWKMNGGLAANAALLAELKAQVAVLASVELVVCVPFLYVAQAQALLAGSGIGWGAQDASEHDEGAYTGEVSALMLQEFGCAYVIVGHSERRTLHAEDDAQVARKFMAVQRAALTPILCVGETLAERDAGHTESVVTRQLRAVIDAAGLAAVQSAVVAYEPVWAIGTGRTPSEQDVAAVHAGIRAILQGSQATPLLYGGSVKPENAAKLLAVQNVDGALVGGASLVAKDFVAIAAGALGARV